MTDSSCLARARRSERRVRAGRHPGGRHSPCHPQAVGDIGGPSGARGMRHAQRPCDRTRREGAWGTTVRQGESRLVRRQTVPGRPPFVPAPSSQTPYEERLGALGLQPLRRPTRTLPPASIVSGDPALDACLPCMRTASSHRKIRFPTTPEGTGAAQLVKTNPRNRGVSKPKPGVIQWLLDSDPSIRWQAMQDLTDTPTEQVAAERARVATCSRMRERAGARRR